MLYTEGDTNTQHDEAIVLMELLTTAYPGHPWAVRVAGGVIFIRYLDVRLSGNWGMAIKTRDSDHDAAVRKHQVIMAAGEWLERAGLARGPANGDEIVDVDGVPVKYKPAPIDVEKVVMADDDGALRTAPRPQVLKD